MSLMEIAGGSDWPEGLREELHRRLDRALDSDDRIILISVRRIIGEGGAGCEISSCCDGRKHSRVSWLEMLGAIHKKLVDWTTDLSDSNT